MKHHIKNNKKLVLNDQNSWASLYCMLKELLDRRQALLPLAREYDAIDNALKTYFMGVPSCRLGEYEVSSCLRKDKRWQVEIKKHH